MEEVANVAMQLLSKGQGPLHFALTPITITAKPNKHAFFLLKPFTIPIISTPIQPHKHTTTTKKKEKKIES